MECHRGLYKIMLNYVIEVDLKCKNDNVTWGDKRWQRDKPGNTDDIGVGVDV